MYTLAFTDKFGKNRAIKVNSYVAALDTASKIARRKASDFVELYSGLTLVNTIYAPGVLKVPYLSRDDATALRYEARTKGHYDNQRRSTKNGTVVYA